MYHANSAQFQEAANRQAKRLCISNPPNPIEVEENAWQVVILEKYAM